MKNPSLSRQDLARVIAHTLQLAPSNIEIGQIGFNERCSALHIRGTFHGQLFFAKRLLSDIFPLSKPKVIPGDSEITGNQPMVTASEQIEREWNMGLLFNELRDPRLSIYIPRPLGKCIEENLIIWEGIEGYSLEMVLKHRRQCRDSLLLNQRLPRHLGMFIRRVHQKVSNGYMQLNLQKVHQFLLSSINNSSGAAREYFKTALVVLDAELLEASSPILHFPKVLTHGDFSLSNIIWDSKNRRFCIVDFEHSYYQMSLFDLITWVCNLRVKLLNPIISPAICQLWESAFWDGYGRGDAQLVRVAQTLGSIWVFAYFLPERLPNRTQQVSFAHSLLIKIYRIFLESIMVRLRKELIFRNG